MSLARLFPKTPPPGPFRPGFWRSPLRGRWLTSTFAVVLLVGVTLVTITGFLSYAAYNPALGTNDLTPNKGLLGFYLFDWPTKPVWLYQVNQGVHVIGGLVLTPVLLAKLWSVIPKLFSWPPFRSPAQALERLSLLALVGGAVFQFATGFMNIAYWYAFPFSFYPAHLYGAWVFTAGFVVHVAIKLPTMRRALRTRRLVDELRVPLDRTQPEERMDAEDELAPVSPAAATLSRRGLLGLVAGSSAVVFVLTAGQTIGGPLTRSVALLAPRGRSYGDGPNDFQVNKPAAAAGVTAEMGGPSYRLELVAGQDGAVVRELSREDLLGLDQYTYELPIACVEGWSTTQTWTGVRLRDLAVLAGVPSAGEMTAQSLQGAGTFATTTFSADQVDAEKSLLALRVNDADLSLDHGFPARIIIPAGPGVHCTKWVSRMTFVA
ncbi:MAG: molybdopterin-dependent oxidoreductase [Solirubrobacteraceae bacterium MAG38_C4-C5]|nr:molybdopterin-dependent oxidoreductase [Candidatus Siliceabacter maunaloa]